MFSGHALYVVSFPWTPTVLSHRIRELLELSARRKRRNTLLSLHKKKKTIVVLLLWRTSLSEWNDNDDEKASQCHASPSVLSLSFKRRWKKEKKTLGISFYPVKPWKLLPAPRVEELLCCDFPFPGRELTVHRPHRVNRPCWRVVCLRSAVRGGLDALTANHRSLRCLGRRNVEHKWINLWWIAIELNVR